MYSPRKILSVSYDPVLLRTRQSVLETGGYGVISVLGFVDAIAACQGEDYDLLILGHSVPYADKRALIEASRKCRHAHVLALIRPGERDVEGASKSSDTSYSPDTLLAAVTELVGDPSP